jgi:hypothetical protein
MNLWVIFAPYDPVISPYYTEFPRIVKSMENELAVKG